jgi:methyl-accepting chemotaxis protein WspA
MFKSTSIRKKLFLGFFSIVAVIVLLLGSAYNNFTNLGDANALDRHTLQVILEGNEIEAASLNTQAEYRGFLLTGNERYLETLKKSEEDMQQHIDRAKRLIPNNVSQQERLKKLQAVVATWIADVVHPIIDKRRELGKGSTVADQMARDPLLATGFKYVTEIKDILNGFIEEENRLLTERSKHAATLQQNVQVALLLGGVLCIIAATVIAFLLAHSILRPLGNLIDTVKKIAAGDESARADIHSNDELGQVAMQFNLMAQTVEDNRKREQEATNQLKGKVDALLEVVSKAADGNLTGKVTVNGDDAIGRMGNGLATMLANLRELLSKVQKAGVQVASSTTEIAASARQQEATGIEQAQTSVEVLSTTKEISANSSQLLKTMEEATEVAELTTTATVDAQDNLRRMDQTMKHMVGAADSINAKLAALSEKASNINNVLITITKVADQTNILSLNAAIEAEKAGEAGRGFSVVATEIRRLADQTSVATWDIEQMLKEMQSAVSASVMGMDKFSEEIRRSVDEVSRVGERLSVVINQAQQLPRHFDAVFEGMQSQSIGASQITDTMIQLSDASQQTVESLKGTSEAVQQLQYAAQELQASVATFTVHA